MKKDKGTQYLIPDENGRVGDETEGIKYCVPLSFCVPLSLIFLFINLVYANLALEMEGGNFNSIESQIAEHEKKGETLQLAFTQSLKMLYQGRIEEAYQTVSKIPDSFFGSTDSLKNYISNLRQIYSQMGTAESEHFIVKSADNDNILMDYGLEALEKSYVKLGTMLDYFPKDKVTVEVYPSLESFSQATTLSEDVLRRSGVIGVCKFRRIMILSPRQLAYGYRWLDTLSHEYIHFLINQKSRGRCPLWLHEGIAKYLDTHWRLEEPLYIVPGNRTELIRAVEEERTIPFSRMEPSLAYLKDQSEVRLAFSEVAATVHMIQKKKAENIKEILSELSQGKSQDEAFQAVLGQSRDEVEKGWPEFLKTENWNESEGAIVDEVKIGAQKDEVDDLAGLQIRSHIRLADRMKLSGQPEAALIQYRKALKMEPNNPIALTKCARLLIDLGENVKSIELLQRAVRENPNYSTAYILLAEQMIPKKMSQDAKNALLEANALNPFNPKVHHLLTQIYHETGDKKNEEKEQMILTTLLKSPR